MQIIERLKGCQDDKIRELMEKDGLSRTEAEAKAGGVDGTYLATIIDRIF